MTVGALIWLGWVGLAGEVDGSAAFCAMALANGPGPGRCPPCCGAGGVAADKTDQKHEQGFARDALAWSELPGRRWVRLD